MGLVLPPSRPSLLAAADCVKYFSSGTPAILELVNEIFLFSLDPPKQQITAHTLLH